MDLQDVVVVNGTTLYYERTGTGPSVCPPPYLQVLDML
jgi:hypothetical protein